MHLLLVHKTRFLENLSGVIKIIVALLFLAFFLPTTSQADTSLTVNQINIEGFPDIVLYLTVSKEKGNPIGGLDRKHFTAQEDTDQVQIKEVTPVSKGQESLAAVLTIDKSGSMKEKPIEDAKEAANSFARNILPQDQVAVVTFDDRVEVLSPLSSDREGLKRSIDAIKAGRDTALNDAILRSIEIVASVKGRKVVIVLTDGKENRSKTTADSVIQAAINSEVPIMTIGLGSGVDHDFLKTIAEKSGGRAFFAEDSSQLPELYRSIASLLINQYRVTLVSPKSLDGLWHRLTIKADTVYGIGATERSYLATLNPVLDPKVILQHRKSEESKSILLVVLLFAIVALILAILGVVLVRRKKAEPVR